MKLLVSFSASAFVTSLKPKKIWEMFFPILFLIGKMLGWNSVFFIALSTASLLCSLQYTDLCECMKKPSGFFKKNCLLLLQF